MSFWLAPSWGDIRTPENARTLEVEVKAVLQSHVVAESDDIVESGGYHYFPAFVGAHAVAGEDP